MLDAVDLLLQAGEVVEASAFTERIAALPNTPRRRVVQARLAWMAGRHDEVEALATSVWEEGRDAERASAAAMLAQMRVLRNDNADAARWAERARHFGVLPAPVASELRGIQAVGLGLSGHAAEGLRLLDDLIQNPTAVSTAHLSGLVGRGLLRMITDDLAGARADLQSCVPGRSSWGLSPHALTGLACLADVEFRAGAWDDSISHAEQAISLVIDTDQAWLLAYVHAMATLTKRNPPQHSSSGYQGSAMTSDSWARADKDAE